MSKPRERRNHLSALSKSLKRTRFIVHELLKFRTSNSEHLDCFHEEPADRLLCFSWSCASCASTFETSGDILEAVRGGPFDVGCNCSFADVSTSSTIGSGGTYSGSSESSCIEVSSIALHDRPPWATTSCLTDSSGFGRDVTSTASVGEPSELFLPSFVSITWLCDFSVAGVVVELVFRREI